MTIAKKVNIKAIILGVLTYCGVLAACLVVGIGGILVLLENFYIVPRIDWNGSAVRLGDLLFSAVGMVLSGYVVGRTAKRNEIMNAAILCGLFLIYHLWRFGSEPLSFYFGRAITDTASGLLGGYLSLKRRMKRDRCAHLPTPKHTP